MDGTAASPPAAARSAAPLRTPEHVGRAVGLSVLAGMLLGTAGTAGALGPASATPIGLGVLRLGVGAVLLLVFLPWIGGAWSSIPRLIRRPTLWVMGAGAGAFQPLFFAAVERVGVGLSTLLAIGSAPVFAGLLGWLVRRDRPTLAWATATVIAISGLVLRSWNDLSVGDGLGLGMAAAAGVGVGCYVVAAKVELDRGGNIVELPGVAYLLGSVMLAPLWVQQPLAWVATPSGLLLALYLGGVTMALANVLQVWGLRGLPPGPAATLMLAEPLTATVLGILLLGERIGAVGLFGLVLVLGGMLLQGRALGTRPRDTPRPQPAM
jgi:drug/metabolite transporter, DME family